MPTPLPLSAEQTIPTPVQGGGNDVAIREGRDGPSRPGGPGEGASKDDDDGDLDVLWVGSSGRAHHLPEIRSDWLRVGVRVALIGEGLALGLGISLLQFVSYTVCVNHFLE